MTVGFEFRSAADDQEFAAYLSRAREAFGKDPYEPGTLRGHGLASVAVGRAGVVGGGLAFPFEQYFGGRAVPSGGLAWLTVAPEARGVGLGGRITEFELGWLRDECGAVVASAWTPAVGMYRAWGWEAATVASSYGLNPRELARPTGGHTVTQPTAEECSALRDTLAAEANGPVNRPGWWIDWKRRVTPDACTLGVVRGGDLVGYASFTHDQVQPWGFDIVVHDFWYDGLDTAPALIEALAGRSPQVRQIRFRRSVLPRSAPLQWSLLQYAVEEQGWYPWMLRILDVKGALEARGWAASMQGRVDVEVVEPSGTARPYRLSFADGHLRVEPGGAGHVRLPATTLAAWYAGGLPLRRARALGMATGSPDEVGRLDSLLGGFEAWLPETF
ncbi:GNAT family N-acetyltransferase [Wenjunlia tyrosinilytica]|uniref:Spore coat protein n=1 Tax=Wenjunlia tyrosinilytica TaxID=1544741 RepID=A0A918E0Y3_9ACTN|nr:GNAT family N-acetyltransferase [Wenjunlia tyrosinilytica]GGO96033.1 spore coat protein [Wenjunlia tyrosinilytica]